MNKTSTDKIKSATPFLTWFRWCLPQSLQAKVRPYLDRPYQLAFNILDCCDSTQPRTVREIAKMAGVAQETARQVLQALKEGGMTFAVKPTQGWQAAQESNTLSDSFSDASKLLNPALESQDTVLEYGKTKQR